LAPSFRRRSSSLIWLMVEGAFSACTTVAATMGEAEAGVFVVCWDSVCSLSPSAAGDCCWAVSAVGDGGAGCCCGAKRMPARLGHNSTNTVVGCMRLMTCVRVVRACVCHLTPPSSCSIGGSTR
jgi:hypothetical protein